MKDNPPYTISINAAPKHPGEFDRGDQSKMTDKHMYSD